jgi:hypothetical protein
MTEPSEEEKPLNGDDGWLEKNHRFWYLATPKIFEWFNWVAVLGALSYLFKKSHSPAVLVLMLLGYLSLIFYFTAFFLRHPPRIPWVRTKHNQEFISGILALLLGYAANVLVQHAVNIFSQGAP